ncbi:MAG: bifunctional riboflavin kinase/FAD synthetase [Oscillospiraceae bacterium]|nr:bifunctional riboflavin kinase/FAD synthetase [Oscillospiraceae bacterium]
MNEQKTIYALGFFDGVHLGHQALLKQCRELAAKHGCNAGVVTFTSHPDGLVLGQSPALLNTSDDRARLLYAYGVDAVKEIPFDRELMSTHWSAFLNSLVAIGAAGFVCGDDFRFGAGGLGTPKKLAAYCNKRNLPYAVVPEQVMDGERISSTRIRELLEEGKPEKAGQMLGHPHILTGEVLAGKQLGRTIGIPTANLIFPEGVIVPKFGVYACKVGFNGKAYSAVTNIGTRPTVNGEGITAEAHILDFEGDLYGKEITVAFCKFLRPEQKFANLDALKAQIAEDIAQTQGIFKQTL